MTVDDVTSTTSASEPDVSPSTNSPIEKPAVESSVRLTVSWRVCLTVAVTCVVSVKVVPEMDPPRAAVAAVGAATSLISRCVRLVPPPMMEFICGLPEPVLRSYHCPATWAVTGKAFLLKSERYCLPAEIAAMI